MVLLVLGTKEWFVWLKGSTTATTFLEVVPLVDPLAAIEVMAAARAVEWTLLVGGGLLLLAALLLGPVFCGWICPLGLLLDLNGSLGGRLRRIAGGLWPKQRGNRLPGGASTRLLRYAILGFVVAFSAAASIPLFQTISPINLVAWSVLFFHSPLRASAAIAEPGFFETCRMAAGNVISVAGALLLLPAAIMAIEIVLPRIWCRAVCPLGALYGLAGGRGFFRVRLVATTMDHGLCSRTPRCARSRTGRGACAEQCPMGIDVSAEFTRGKKRSLIHEACTRCGACVDACPRKAYRIGFGDRSHG